jgi:D-tyrosyl-tRNA(Tyr) deacylase
MVVSQFTLYADVRKGRRPSFGDAMEPKGAQELVQSLARALERLTGTDVAQGVFGAHMEVELVNDGPVTLMVETKGGKVC